MLFKMLANGVQNLQSPIPNPQSPMPAFLLAMLIASVALADDDATQPTITYGAARRIAELANEQVLESSGCAASPARRDVFYTHNDSGSGAAVYAFNSRGEDLGSWSIPGAMAIDWEDMASYSDGERHLLVLADIGDNGAVRAECQLYLVEEPDPRHSTAQLVRTIRLRYPDGAHNCEAVGIDPTTRTAFVVTKTWTAPCQVFAVRLDEQPGPGPQPAQAIAELNLILVTAMDISPDGRRAVVLTYGHAYQYERNAEESWTEAFRRPGQEIVLPFRQQSEAICYGRDGKTLYLTSEKLPTPLWEVPPQ